MIIKKDKVAAHVNGGTKPFAFSSFLILLIKLC